MSSRNPAIITVLTAAARWDERPFLDMLARKAFPLILARDLDDRVLLQSCCGEIDPG